MTCKKDICLKESENLWYEVKERNSGNFLLKGADLRKQMKYKNQNENAEIVNGQMTESKRHYSQEGVFIVLK